MIEANLIRMGRAMNLRKQNGLTILGFLIVLSLVIFFAIVGMKITPIYLEYYSVVSAMEGVANEPGSARYRPFDVKRKILDRLYLSYSADNVTEHDIKVTRRNGVHVRVVYDVRKPMFGNLDIIASFDESRLLRN